MEASQAPSQINHFLQPTLLHVAVIAGSHSPFVERTSVYEALDCAHRRVAGASPLMDCPSLGELERRCWESLIR